MAKYTIKNFWVLSWHIEAENEKKAEEEFRKIILSGEFELEIAEAES